uniref:Pentatricopeptide repeat-containing protein n=1 Tax=Setaria viridis TaxID=4556 RepID=A0A4U6SXG1_SETVI|nr:hypothetical protein SEVIR_9G236900v2 [Setaria viridis]
MTPRALLSRLRLAPLLHDGHHLRRFLSAAAAPPPDEGPPASRLQAFRRSYRSALPHQGLSWSVDERSLTDAFSSFGTITEDGARGRCSTRCCGGCEPLHRAQSRELFDEMPVRDVVACSVAIYRHARSGSFHHQTCSVGVLLGALLAECIHVGRLGSNPFVATALVDAYAKCGCPMNALTFLEALLAFKRLCCCFGLVPNNIVTMINVAQAYAGCGGLVMCKSAHAYAVKIGLDLGDFRKTIVRDVVSWTMMMGFLLEQVHACEVISLFVQMRSNGIVPDRVVMVSLVQACAPLSDARRGIVSWTAMVSGYLGSGKALEGMHLFGKMRCEDIFVIDSVTLVSLLTGCYKIARFELCVQLHGHSYKSGLYLHRHVPNTLMAVYGNCGYASSAHKVFGDMISRDVVSWNTMILSYDIVTYLNTMLACSHSGLVDDGLIIFRRMINENHINPCQEHIGCLVDMLARSGRLDEAAEVASFTSKVGSNSWKALMGGGHLHSDTELTEVAAKKVLNIKSFDYGHMVLLSNAYASAGKYIVAESIRSCYSKQTKKEDSGS